MVLPISSAEASLCRREAGEKEKWKRAGYLGYQAGGSVCEGDSGRFPIYSTKTFEKLETTANGTDIFRKSFQKFWKLLNFQNANHSIKYSRNSGNKVECKENFWEISENLSIPREVFLFFGNFAKCCSIRHWQLSIIQTERFGWMEIKAPMQWCYHLAWSNALWDLDVLSHDNSFCLIFVIWYSYRFNKQLKDSKK